VCESTLSTTNQVKTKNRNQMAHETLDDSLPFAPLTLVLRKERQRQRNLDHRPPTHRHL